MTVDKNGFSYNFSNSYTVGFPMGINILKSEKIGFSLEVAPFVKSAESTEKVTNVLFHPGLMLRYPKGFTIISRLAFDTSGRYGATLVFSKVIARTEMNSYFIAIPIPFRTGNNVPSSIGAGFQIGVTF